MDNKQTKHNSIQLFSPQFPALNIITFLNTFLKLTFNFFISSLLFFPPTPPMYSTLLTPELMVSFTGMAVTHADMLKSQQHDCLNKIWERVVPTDLTWTPTLDTEYVISRLSIRYRIIGVLFLEKTISSLSSFLSHPYFRIQSQEPMLACLLVSFFICCLPSHVVGISCV